MNSYDYIKTFFRLLLGSYTYYILYIRKAATYHRRLLID